MVVAELDSCLKSMNLTWKLLLEQDLLYLEHLQNLKLDTYYLLLFTIEFYLIIVLISALSKFVMLPLYIIQRVPYLFVRSRCSPAKASTFINWCTVFNFKFRNALPVWRSIYLTLIYLRSNFSSDKDGVDFAKTTSLSFILLS